MAVRDITLGQYFPGESCIHRLDPRVKIVCTFVYLISLFVVKSFSAFLLCILFLGTVIALSKIPFKFISKGLKPVIFLIILTMVINLFFVSTGDVLAKLGPITITKDGIYRALFMGLRLVLLIFGSSLMTLTTKPIELTDGMEKLLSPLAKIGLPAHELAMMMTISTAFLIKIGTPESLAKRDELWAYLKKHSSQYKYVHRHFLGKAMQMKTRPGMWIIKVGYTISQRLVGFN